MITFEVPGTLKSDDSTRPMNLPFTLYIVKAHTDLSSYRHQPHYLQQPQGSWTEDRDTGVVTLTIQRRYSDFMWLQRSLQQLCRGVVVPPIPAKSLEGTLSKLTPGNPIAQESDFVYLRRMQLEVFMNALGQHPVLHRREELLAFLIMPLAEFTVFKDRIDAQTSGEKLDSHHRQMSLYRIVQAHMGTSREALAQNPAAGYVAQMKKALADLRVLIESISQDRCKQAQQTLTWDGYSAQRMPSLHPQSTVHGLRVVNREGAWGNVVYVSEARDTVGVVWDTPGSGNTDGTDPKTLQRLFIARPNGGSFVDPTTLRHRLPRDEATDALDEVSEQLEGTLQEVAWHWAEPKPYQYLLALLLYCEGYVQGFEAHLEGTRSLRCLLKSSDLWLQQVRQGKRDVIHDELTVDDCVGRLTPFLHQLVTNEKEELYFMRRQVTALMHKIASVLLSNNTHNALDFSQSSSANVERLEIVTAAIHVPRTAGDISRLGGIGKGRGES